LSVLITKNTEETLTGSFDGVCNQTGRLVPSVTVTQTWDDNDNLTLETSDYRTFSTQGSILYREPLLGDVSLFGQYVQTRFPHRLFATASGVKADGYTTYVGGAKVDHHFGSQLDFQFSLSDTSLRSDSGFSPNFNGITYNAVLTYQVGPRLSLVGEATRETNPSNRLDAAYSIGEVYSASANYLLTTELKLGLGASDNREAYKGAALRPGIDLTRESVKSFFGTLGYNITPNLSVNLGINQDQRHADVAGYSYASTRFSLSVSQAF
jgi:hypothetical protein